jgi:hypothetical protein
MEKTLSKAAHNYGRSYEPKNETPKRTAETAFKHGAQWDRKVFEGKVMEVLYECFYVHPHDCNHICTDDFECRGDFDAFAEAFMRKVRNA